MALILDGASGGDTGTTALNGNATVIVNGVFAGAVVTFSLGGDGVTAPLDLVGKGNVFEVNAKLGHTLNCAVNGGGATTSISVSVLE